MRFGFICLLCLGLVACGSTVKNNDLSYLNSYETKPITIPHGLSSSSISNEYPLPSVKSNQHTQTPSLIPPGTK